ncbi:serine hydrolase domain-containing protein [Congregibacter sp.]|uniref:serine hydrolase domain-containing protein n=1 Tax=Congregibacter sp. TaxID=2744308 RepID=UPI003F6AFF89
MDFTHVDPSAAAMSEGRLKRIGEHLERSYVEPGKIAGCLTVVLRGDQLAYVHVAGQRDRERELPMTDDTVFRIYSMTKPIVSIALMSLWERGLFSLNDPVHRFIPQWKDLQVREGGSYPDFQIRAPERPMRIRDLLTHQSGLTYDFMQSTEIDRAYRQLNVARPVKGYTLQDMIEQLATLPLEFSPGDRWNYSVATDVVGYLVERISGQSLADYLQSTFFDPLGMCDTSFSPRDDQLQRFASCYTRDGQKRLVLQDDAQSSQYMGRSFYSGGGGLVSTAADYLRFCQMLLGRGALNGQRIISRKTLEFMTANHLPGEADLASVAMAGFTETAHEGVGFGLGFASKIDPVVNGYPATQGSFYWGGMASTLFWVDPVEDLAVVFMTQLIPSSTFNFRGQLEALVYAALD